MVSRPIRLSNRMAQGVQVISRRVLQTAALRGLQLIGALQACIASPSDRPPGGALTFSEPSAFRQSAISWLPFKSLDQMEAVPF